MPRRRVYILRIEDYLHHDPAPPSRVRPALRLAALAAGIVGFGVLPIRLVAPLLPSDATHTLLIVTFAYAFILLLFISLAKRLNHIE